MYQGFVRIYGGPAPTQNPAVLLATGASVNQVYTPLPSTSVFGSGWYNAADAAHYADGQIHFEGGVDFDLEVGDGGRIWDFLMYWSINERAYPRSLDISPDGSRVYQYRAGGNYGTYYGIAGAWCNELSFSTAPDSLVTSSASVMAINRVETNPAGAVDNFSNYTYIKQVRGVILNDYTNSFAPTSPLNPDCLNINPIPFWRTNAQIYNLGPVCSSLSYTPFTVYDPAVYAPQTGLETVEWSITNTNNALLLITCSGSRLPRAVLMGPHNATGTVTLYHPNGPFDPILGPDGDHTLTTPYVCACSFIFQVQIRTNAVNPATYVYIEMPAIYIESETFDIPGQDAITNRTYNMRGLGGRKAADGDYGLPPIIMSDHDGAYVPPAANP